MKRQYSLSVGAGPSAVVACALFGTAGFGFIVAGWLGGDSENCIVGAVFIGIGVFLGLLRVRSWVSGDVLVVRMIPFPVKRLRLSEITDVNVEPAAKWRGLGWRWLGPKHWAYVTGWREEITISTRDEQLLSFSRRDAARFRDDLNMLRMQQ